jgi:hypothetical protein
MQDKVVHTVTNSGIGAKYLIFCPGCNCCHGWNDRWTFDGNLDCPTVSPSLLVTHLRNYTSSESEPTYDGICHSFIRNGNIEFLSDCTHKLAGQTVKLEPW